MGVQALPVVDLKAVKYNDFELEHTCLIGEQFFVQIDENPSTGFNNYIHIDGDVLEVNESDNRYIFKIIGSKFLRNPIGHHTREDGLEVSDSSDLDDIPVAQMDHPDSLTGVGGTRVFQFECVQPGEQNVIFSVHRYKEIEEMRAGKSEYDPSIALKKGFYLKVDG